MGKPSDVFFRWILSHVLSSTGLRGVIPSVCPSVRPSVCSFVLPRPLRMETSSKEALHYFAKWLLLKLRLDHGLYQNICSSWYCVPKLGSACSSDGSTIHMGVHLACLLWQFTIFLERLRLFFPRSLWQRSYLGAELRMRSAWGFP